MSNKTYKAMVGGIVLDYEFPGFGNEAPAIAAFVDHDLKRIVVHYERELVYYDDVSYYLSGGFFFHRNRNFGQVYTNVDWDTEANFATCWEDVWDDEHDRYSKAFLDAYPAGAWRIVDAYTHSGTVFSEHGCGYQCRWDTSSGVGVWVPDKYCMQSIKRELPLYKYMKLEATCMGYVGSFLKDGKIIFSCRHAELYKVIQYCKDAISTVKAVYGKFDLQCKTDAEAWYNATQMMFLYDCKWLSDGNMMTEIVEVEFNMDGSVLYEGETQEALPQSSEWYCNVDTYLASSMQSRFDNDENVYLAQAWGHSIGRLEGVINATPLVVVESGDQFPAPETPDTSSIELRAFNEDGTYDSNDILGGKLIESHVVAGCVLHIQSGAVHINQLLPAGVYVWDVWLQAWNRYFSTLTEDIAARILRWVGETGKRLAQPGWDPAAPANEAPLREFYEWQASLQTFTADKLDALLDVCINDMSSPLRNCIKLPDGVVLGPETASWLRRKKLIQQLKENAKTVTIGNHVYGFVNTNTK